MCRLKVNIALALSLKATLALLPVENTVDLKPSGLSRPPFLLRDDSNLGALLNDPLFFRTLDLPHLSRKRILHCRCTIPDKTTNVLLIT